MIWIMCLEPFVDGIASEAIESDSTVGMSIAIAQGAEVALAKGYGFADIESKVPAIFVGMSASIRAPWHANCGSVALLKSIPVRMARPR